MNASRQMFDHIDRFDPRVRMDERDDEILKVPTRNALGEIRLGEIVVPHYPPEFGWADLFTLMQRNAADRHFRGPEKPITMAPELITSELPLPEPGIYDIGVWTMAGEPVPGGIANRLADARQFWPEEAEAELHLAGFEGSPGLFMAVFCTDYAVYREGFYASLGPKGQRFAHVDGQEWMIYRCLKIEAVVRDKPACPSRWELNLAKLTEPYLAEWAMLGFRLRQKL